MRFASYRTLYYQAAYHNGLKINKARELIAAYADGLYGLEPRAQRHAGNVRRLGGGRTCECARGSSAVRMTNAKVLGSSAKTTLGPVVVKIDSSRKKLVADLITAIPELNENLEKADFGSLLLQARGATGNVTPIVNSYVRPVQQGGLRIERRRDGVSAVGGGRRGLRKRQDRSSSGAAGRSGGSASAGAI